MSGNEEGPVDLPGATTDAATEHYNEAIVARARAVLYEPPEQIGPYRVFERIGGGGMGDVYRAEQREGVRRPVAIKLIRPGFDSRQIVTRFEAERQALAMMHHPHIAQVYAAGNDETGRPYFAMEYVPGKPVTQFADDNKLTVRQRLELFLQICSAVSHAHTKLIIHRDIKAGNVLAYFNDEKQPVVKVIDFGVAKALSGKSLSDATLYTAHGEILGTYDSMSPEQATGSSDIDTRTDVYSLGVLLYELLTGAKPFDYARVADQEIRRIIREVEPPPPSTRLSSLGEVGSQIAAARRSQLDALTKELGSELEWIPLMAMRKERDRRYESATALAADVERYLNGEALEAGPESIAYRAKKYLSRHKSAIASVAAVALVLVAGIITSSLLAVRARKAERIVEAQIVTVKEKESEAQRDRSAAISANSRAEAESQALKRALADTYVDRGVSAMEGNDPALAALWYAGALKLDAGDVDRAHIQRIRLNYAFNRAAQLRDVPIGSMFKNNTTGNRFVRIVPGDKNVVQVVDSTTGEFACPPIEIEDAIESATLSPDGQAVVTKTKIDEVRLWSATSGKPLTAAIKHGRGSYWSGPDSHWFSPDSKVFAIFSGNRLRLYDARNGHGIVESQADKQNSVATFSPDGRLIATGNNAGIGQLWDLSTGQPASPELKHSSRVTSMAFSPDGKRLATQCQSRPAGEYFVRVWDTQTGLPLIEPVRSEYYARVVFSHDGNAIAAISGKSVFILRDAGSRTQRTHSIEQKTSWIQDALFSPDDRTIAISNSNNTVGVRSSFTGRPISPLIAPGSEVTHLVFSPDGKALATACKNRSIRVWDATTGTPLSSPLWHSDEVTQLEFTLEGKEIATETKDGTRRVWSLEQSTPAKVITERSRFESRSAAISPDTGSALAQVWDASSGAPLSPPVRHPAMVMSGAFSPDDKILVTYCIDEVARAWDARTGERLPWRTEFGSWLGNQVFNSRGTVQVRHRLNGSYFWDIGKNRSIGPMMYGASGTFSPDSALFLTISNARDGAGIGARVWDSTTGKAVIPLLPRRYLSPAFFSPDGKTVSVVGTNSVSVWPLLPTELSVDDAQQLAELLSASAIDDGSALIPVASEEWRKRWSRLRAKLPDLLAGSRPAAQQSEILPAYRAAVESQIRSAPSDDARKELSKRMSLISFIERESQNYEESHLLAESAVKLDNANLDAYANVAAANLTLNRYEDALAIYEKYRDRHYNEWYYPANKDVVFGYNASGIIAALRKNGISDPRLARLEAILPSRQDNVADERSVWDQLMVPTASREFYQQASKSAENSIQAGALDKDYFNVLGYAQYRLGDVRSAIATLNRPEAIDPDRTKLDPGKRRHLADWAFLAMSHFRLGDFIEAGKYLDEFEGDYSASDESRHERYRALAEEAEQLIHSAADQSSKSSDTAPVDGVLKK